MVELLDYLIKILGDETGNDELKNKLRYIKSLIEANQTLNDVNLSFTEKEIKIFKELCIKILNESPNYGCKTIDNGIVNEKGIPVTEEREYRPLESIKDNYPKYVLTLDYLLQQRNGIKHENIIKFLIDKKLF